MCVSNVPIPSDRTSSPLRDSAVICRRVQDRQPRPSQWQQLMTRRVHSANKTRGHQARTLTHLNAFAGSSTPPARRVTALARHAIGIRGSHRPAVAPRSRRRAHYPVQSHARICPRSALSEALGPSLLPHHEPVRRLSQHSPHVVCRTLIGEYHSAQDNPAYYAASPLGAPQPTH